MKILAILIGILILYILLKTVKIVRVLLTVILGIIYMPLNQFYMVVQRWYFHMKKKDEVIYYAFTPFYWILVGIVFVISVPYEFVIAMDIH